MPKLQPYKLIIRTPTTPISFNVVPSDLKDFNWQVDTGRGLLHFESKEQVKNHFTRRWKADIDKGQVSIEEK